jgi:hypothetical protein
MLYDPPRYGNGIHWRALSMLLAPPGVGVVMRVVSGPIEWWPLSLIFMLALPVATFASWKYSCYVAETHAQPWGFLSFFASMASCWGWFICLAARDWV